MVDFETTFPADAITVIVNKLRGKDVPLVDLARAELTLQSYAMGVIFAQRAMGAAAPVMLAEASPMTNEEMACCLEDLAAHHEDGRVAAVAGFNWIQLLPLLIQIIQIISKGS